MFWLLIRNCIKFTSIEIVEIANTCDVIQYERFRLLWYNRMEAWRVIYSWRWWSSSQYTMPKKNMRKVFLSNINFLFSYTWLSYILLFGLCSHHRWWNNSIWCCCCGCCFLYAGIWTADSRDFIDLTLPDPLHTHTRAQTLAVRWKNKRFLSNFRLSY